MAIYQGDILLGQGAKGQSAYGYALDGGYIGTEEEFAEGLAKAPNLYDEVQILKGMLNGITLGHTTYNGVECLTATYDDGQ